MKSPPTLTYTIHHSPYPAIDPRHNAELDMSGKTVMITGGGRSIGKAIAKSFAQANASNIIMVGRTQSALISTSQEIQGQYKSHVHSFVLDLASLEECKQVMELVRKDIGNVDVLVLNAAHLHAPSSISSDDFALDDFFRCFEINVKGNLNLTRLFLKQAPKNATLINITSFMAYLPAFPYAESGYASSKAAFGKVLEYLHMEKPELRIFNLHPGSVISNMLVKCGVDSEDDRILFDDPMLPGNFCVWLASSKADFLNGRTVEAMWDVDELEASKVEILADPRVFTVGLMSRGDVALVKQT